jgi:protein TonB
MMLSLAASLLVIALCFHLPLTLPPDPIGWRSGVYSKEPMLDLVDIDAKPSQDGAGVPVTTFGANEEEIEIGEDESTKAEEPDNETEALPSPSTLPPLEKLNARPALEYADKMPDIAGGMGAYYIHIEYPQEAIDEGIEGRMVLAFVVETDGRPSEIEVLRSLHPLCDSSAVRALRKTRFIPGRQGDHLVRVRMRLPVLFRLIDATPEDSTQTNT